MKHIRLTLFMAIMLVCSLGVSAKDATKTITFTSTAGPCQNAEVCVVTSCAPMQCINIGGTVGFDDACTPINIILKNCCGNEYPFTYTPGGINANFQWDDNYCHFSVSFDSNGNISINYTTT